MKSSLKFVLVAILLTAGFCDYAKSQVVSPVKNDSTTYKRAQNVFVEIGGPGLAFSANYDSRFGNRRDGFGGRLGAGYIAADGNSLFTLPLQFNYLLGKKGKYFEIGLGATYFSTTGNEDDFFSFDNSSAVIGTMTFGYRYQPLDGGFHFRASLNPVFNSSNFIPYYAGLGFGYTF